MYTYEPTMEFQDYWSFLDACKNTNARHCHSAYSAGDPENWYGTRSFNAAIKLAEEGWPEGLRMIKQVQMETPIKDKELWVHSFGGALPDVPLYLTGSPEHMMVMERQPKPTLVVECARGVRAHVSVRQYMEHGAMVLSLLDLAEEVGYPVELWITIHAFSYNGKYLHRILAKKAGEHMEMDRLAFMMAHPSFHRRLIFSLREMTGGGVGGSEDVPVNSRVPDSIYIPMLWDETQIQKLKDKFMQEISNVR